VALAIVERAQAALVGDGDIDFKKYMHPQERNRIIPAESLAEECRREMLLGAEKEPGLLLPWDKARDVVKIPPGILVLWAGWSRHGKSQMLKQVMLHAMNEGEKACIASMEETIKFIWKEMGKVACGTRTPAGPDLDDWLAFQTGRLWFYDRRGQVDPAKIEAVIRYCAAELGITQFVVDSLMMMAMARDDYNAQAAFATRLKALAEETRCTVHLVVHLKKRDGRTGEDSPGGMHDIAGGHELSSAADTVFNVWRNINKAVPGNPDCILTVEKQRGEFNWLGKLGLSYHEGSRQYVEGNQPMRFWRDRSDW
jgi:twinkle protein